MQSSDKPLHVFAFGIKDDHKAGEQFDKLGHDDGCDTWKGMVEFGWVELYMYIFSITGGAEKHVTGSGAAVTHAETEYGILQRQRNQAYVLERVRVHWTRKLGIRD